MFECLKRNFYPNFKVGKDKKNRVVHVEDVLYSPVSDNYYRVKYDAQHYNFFLKNEIVKSNVREKISLMSSMIKIENYRNTKVKEN